MLRNYTKFELKPYFISYLHKHVVSMQRESENLKYIYIYIYYGKTYQLIPKCLKSVRGLDYLVKRNKIKTFKTLVVIEKTPKISKE